MKTINFCGVKAIFLLFLITKTLNMNNYKWALAYIDQHSYIKKSKDIWNNFFKDIYFECQNDTKLSVALKQQALEVRLVVQKYPFKAQHSEKLL